MSAISTIEFADLNDVWMPGRHTLVVGQPRSGKTTALLSLTKGFFIGGETVVVRDIGEYYEFFSLLDHYTFKTMPKEPEALARAEEVIANRGFRILGHVPKDCRILFEHRNFEQMEFDVRKVSTLFEHFDPERINLIFVESFTLELRHIIKFWSSFFRTILKWKQRPGKGGIWLTLILDEFGDIAPGKGRTFLPDQNRMSQLIAVNHRKFRRHNIRLEAAVHYFRDITPPIRERFDCYIVNKNYPNEKEVPFTLRGYAHAFPKLEVDEIYYLDASKGYNKMKYLLEVEPKSFYDISVSGLGRGDALLAGGTKKGKWEKIAETWKERAVLAADELIDVYEWRVGQVANLWRISRRMLNFHRESVHTALKSKEN